MTTPLRSVGTLAALSMLGAGTLAQAQTADPGDAQLTEIVVTAEHRSENLEKTPLAISVVSQAALDQQGVVNIVGLQDLVPSLNIVERGGTGTNIAVRGLVTNTTAPQGGPSIAVNVDEIFVARTQATDANFYDLSRIEVLRGPQGTLYGKNSTAGAINIITNNPTQTFAANVAVETGDYGTVNTSGMVNLPISDTLALRAAFQTTKHDGYIGQLDDADTYAARIKLLYTPITDLSILLTLHYNHIGGHGPGDVGYSLAPGAVNPSNAWTQNLYPPYVGDLDNELWGIDAHIVWDLHFATLTYITGFESFNADNSQIAQLQAISTFSQSAHQVSNELRLTSENASTTAGSIFWQVGLYSFNEAQSYYPNIVSGPLNVVEVEPSIPDNSQAAFGQATYSITDSWRLTAGLRYTRDHAAQSGTFTEHLGPNVTEFPITGEVNFSNTSYKAGIEKDLAPQIMAYASVTTGYHAGGLTDSIPATAPQGNTYLPEHVTDYEVGIKGRYFDNRVQLNSDVFYYNYTDLQVGVLAPPFFPTTYNADKARLFGWELEGSWLITNNDLFAFSTIYEDSKYIDYCVPSAYYSGTGPITTCPSGELGYNYDNQPFNNVPKWAGNASFQHTFPLSNGSKLVPAVVSRFKGHYTAGNVNEVLPSYTDTTATLTFTAPQNRWSVMGYVRNIENKPDYTSTGTLIDPTLDLRTLVPPRTYGVRFSANW